MSVDDNIITSYPKRRWKKILIWFTSFIFGGFFLISAVGWFFATYLMMKGKLGPKPTEFYQSLNILDHIVRSSQVLLVIVASMVLLLRKQLAVKLYLANLIVSIICFVAIGKWGISFLTPLPIIVVYGYSYWIKRLGYLK
jgi:fatty acid desaturase